MENITWKWVLMYSVIKSIGYTTCKLVVLHGLSKNETRRGLESSFETQKFLGV